MIEKIDIYNAAISKWGIIRQTFMLMEECGELLTVVAQAKRNRVSKDDIITELADVSIMVEQLAVFYGYTEYINEKERKLQRLKERIAKSAKN